MKILMIVDDEIEKAIERAMVKFPGDIEVYQGTATLDVLSFDMIVNKEYQYIRFHFHGTSDKLELHSANILEYGKAISRITVTE